MKDIKNKHVFLNFEHLVKRSYSEACILSKIAHYLIFGFQIDGSAQNYANSIFRNFTGDRKNFTVCLTLETSK